MSRKPAPASAQQRSRKTRLKRRKIATLTREEVRTRSERNASKYTAKDFEEIADALGLLPARVKQEARSFESVARWYFLDRRAPNRARPTDIRKQVLKIRDAADRLLIHLGIDNPAEASDGPGDPEVFAALM